MFLATVLSIKKYTEPDLIQMSNIGIAELWRSKGACGAPWVTSSETQGQIVGTRKSLNGRENMARRKVTTARRAPGDNVFSETNQKPERRRPFGTGLVRHCPQGLFSPFFTFFRAIFFRPFRLFLVPTICPWVSEDVWVRKRGKLPIRENLVIT